MLYGSLMERRDVSTRFLGGTYSIWAASWQNQRNGMCAQRRLRSAWASAKSDQSLRCALCVAKDPRCRHADSEDSDQTGRMPRLIWVFAGRTGHFVGFVMRRLILICIIGLFAEQMFCRQDCNSSMSEETGQTKYLSEISCKPESSQNSLALAKIFSLHGILVSTAALGRHSWPLVVAAGNQRTTGPVSLTWVLRIC